MLGAATALSFHPSRSDDDNLPMRALGGVMPSRASCSASAIPIEALNLPPGQRLPKDAWRDVAVYLPRPVLLNLRTVSHRMADVVDRSITTLTVSAERAVAMLAMINRADYVNHIDTLTITHCNNRNFPAVADALEMPPWEGAHLVIQADENLPFDEVGLACLRPLSLSSLSIANLRSFSAASALVLAALRYPVSLTLYGSDHNLRVDMCAIAAIPQLVSFVMGGFSTVFGRVADAFQKSQSLSKLSLWGGSVSSGALATLAANPALREMDITQTRAVFDMKALAAIAVNTSLQSLTIGDNSHCYDDAAASVLATNTALKTLDIALGSGLRHLAKMTALERLTVWGADVIVTRQDAEQFARDAKLKMLHFSSAVKFEDGTLGMIARASVAALRCSDVIFTSDDIGALLSNKTLRTLNCRFAAGAPDSVAQAIALAGHPTLEKLSLRLPNRALTGGSAVSPMTVVDRASMNAAWTVTGRALCELNVGV